MQRWSSHRLVGTNAKHAYRKARLQATIAGAPFWFAARGVETLHLSACLERPTVASFDLIMRNPEGHRLAKPGLDVASRVDDHLSLTTAWVRVTTDTEGLRDAQLTLDEAEIVTVGDGFAFGLGACDARLYTRMANVPTKTAGCPGYSMADGVLTVERLGTRLRGKTVVWFPYLGNDLTDNLRPFLGTEPVPYARRRRGRWELHHDHVHHRGSLPLEPSTRIYPVDLAAICSDVPESRCALAAADFFLERMADLCRSVDASLVVVSIPRRAQLTARGRRHLQHLSPDPVSFDAQRPDKHMRTTCNDLGVIYVALLDHLSARDYQPGDRLHWRRSGHRKIGDILSRVHRRVQQRGSVG